MQQYQLIRQQEVSRPLERIFTFFEKPENLGLITPPSLEFKLLNPSPVEMKLRQIIDYRIRLSGIPMHWQSLISEYNPPYNFADEQQIGPYSYWRHLHQFEQIGSNTRIIDRVIYSLPSYFPRPLETTINRLYVAPTLKRIFDYRQRVFAEIFSSGNHITDRLTP